MPMNPHSTYHGMHEKRQWTRVMLVLGLCGLAINLFLLVRHLSNDVGVAGCGGGDCDDVLDSRWSMVFGIPVTVFGVIAYLGLLISLRPRFERGLIPLLGIITGAAVWFILLQALVLKQFCVWCMTAHGIAIALLISGWFRDSLNRATGKWKQHTTVWLVAGFSTILLAQVLGPVPASHRIDDAGAASRTVSFGGERDAYDVSQLPRCGPVDAKHVLVEYFDYQCAACRTMAGFLDALIARHPDQLAVILLPVPLEGSCNPFLGKIKEHPGSCEITRMALAVWRTKPDAFPEFHQALLDPQSDEITPANARILAQRHLNADELAMAVKAPWIDELMYANITDWRSLSASTPKLPKLLIRKGRIIHGLPSGEADFIRVMEIELGLAPP
jgi:uncharacterized membrane protein